MTALPKQLDVVVSIPMKLPSVANQRLHWAAKARQVKAQRNATRLMLNANYWQFGPEPKTKDRIEVTLTRVAPRKLDSDNLASAFKGVRDEIAAYFGIDDADPRIEWRYEQRKGPARVEIRIEARP